MSKRQRVQFKRLNWDTEFYRDIFTNNGFVITERAEFITDEGKKKSLYGPRSILYGTSYEDETAFIERYRCQCGEFKGKLFEGEICPLCHKPVEFKDNNIKFTGWISLGNNYIINPYYYNRLSECFGKSVISEIIEQKMTVDIDGNRHKVTADNLDFTPTHPFYGIGVVEFKERFDEVIEFFKKKKKKKASEIEALRKQVSSVFTCHIPIYSTLLRPQSATSDTFYYNSIDRHINPIISLSEKLKSSEDIDKSYILNRIQKRVNDLWDQHFELLHGKEGIIRGQILGGSLNYTARNVIVPDPTLRDDEVDLSYHTFLELFKFKIIYYLMKMDDITLSAAYDRWAASYMFDSKIYEVMNFIVNKEKAMILMNRNPTLNYYSMLLMKIREVKKSINDYTLSVPLAVLPGLNADFDGDILNIIGIVTDELKHAFRKFDPVSRMIISRDNGLLNEYFSLSKGQLIDLYYFLSL